MDSGLIRCTNCDEELPEDQFSEIQLATDSICDQCLDEMAEDDEDEVAEESEDDSIDEYDESSDGLED